jgi:DNA-directed RNA polymerase specialized sigma24 family protein
LISDQQPISSGAYRRIGALCTVGSFGAWMFSIIRRECPRLMRSIRGQIQLLTDDDRICAYYATPGLRIDLVAAIQSLRDKYREAIVLRNFEEYSMRRSPSRCG